MAILVVWDDDQQVTVQSVTELEALLDRLPCEVQSTLPFTVECQVDDQTCLMLTLGSGESHVEFYAADHRPPIVVGRGPWHDDTFVPFYHRWRYAEVERFFFVPMTDARQALREYVQTGQRPRSIGWNDDKS